MSWNRYYAFATFAISFSALASNSASCPTALATAKNVLVGARLFDGQPSEMVELAPDNENSATWAIQGYRKSNRTLVLVCDYKNGKNKKISVPKTANKCTVRGERKTFAWCD